MYLPHSNVTKNACDDIYKALTTILAHSKCSINASLCSYYIWGWVFRAYFNVELIIAPEEARLCLVKFIQLPPIPKKLYSLNVLFQYLFGKQVLTLYLDI